MSFKRGDYVSAAESKVWAWTDHALDWFNSDDFGFVIEGSHTYCGMDNMIKILHPEGRREIWVSEQDIRLIKFGDCNGS